MHAVIFYHFSLKRKSADNINLHKTKLNKQFALIYWGYNDIQLTKYLYYVNFYVYV